MSGRAALAAAGVRASNVTGAVSAPAAGSALHRVACPCVASSHPGDHELGEYPLRVLDRHDRARPTTSPKHRKRAPRVSAPVQRPDGQQRSWLRRCSDISATSPGTMCALPCHWGCRRDAARSQLAGKPPTLCCESRVRTVGALAMVPAAHPPRAVPDLPSGLAGSGSRAARGLVGRDGRRGHSTRATQLLDADGTGDITELTRERGRYRSVRYTGEAYASGRDGTVLVNAQAQPVARGRAGLVLTHWSRTR